MLNNFTGFNRSVEGTWVDRGVRQEILITVKEKASPKEELSCRIMELPVISDVSREAISSSSFEIPKDLNRYVHSVFPDCEFGLNNWLELKHENLIKLDRDKLEKKKRLQDVIFTIVGIVGCVFILAAMPLPLFTLGIGLVVAAVPLYLLGMSGVVAAMIHLARRPPHSIENRLDKKLLLLDFFTKNKNYYQQDLSELKIFLREKISELEVSKTSELNTLIEMRRSNPEDEERLREQRMEAEKVGEVLEQYKRAFEDIEKAIAYYAQFKSEPKIQVESSERFSFTVSLR